MEGSQLSTFPAKNSPALSLEYVMRSFAPMIFSSSRG